MDSDLENRTFGPVFKARVIHDVTLIRDSCPQCVIEELGVEGLPGRLIAGNSKIARVAEFGRRAGLRIQSCKG